MSRSILSTARLLRNAARCDNVYTLRNVAHTQTGLFRHGQVSKQSLIRGYSSTVAGSTTASASSSLPPPPPPPSRLQRSLVSRFLRTVGLALVFVPVGFVMATVPAVPAIAELTNPPTDAETAELFQPGDARTAEIDRHIRQHPIAQTLRRAPGFVESRPFLKLPPSAQAHHLTSGALGGPGKLWVPPLMFAEEGGRSTVVLLYLGRDLCGYPGVVHGGMLATLLDEGLAKCCFGALPHKVGMTASLTVDYKAPTPADTYVVLRGTTTRVEGRKAWVEGRIEQLDPPEGKEPVVYATAKALFVEPKQAATMQLLFPAASG